LKQGPQGEELLLLNRMLLEEAYPGEIAPGLALYRESIEGESEFSETPKKMAREIRRLKEVMGQYFTHEVDRLMSRRQIPLYPHYDAASLAFSMHGRVLMDESFRRSPLFRACVQAIVDDQNQDGTWPVGRSATFDDTGTAIQQPSIAVALSLAECIFRPELLRGNRSDEVEVLKIGLEALRKIAQYLALSFTSARRGDGKECYGWVSDRVRWPHVSETWITAMATRVFHILWLAERVCARDEMLSKYGVRGEAGARDGARAQNKVPGSAARKVNLLAAWAAEVVDPDIHAKPGDALVRKVLTPLQKQLDEGVNFIRPAEDGVSFIIFGPPGSGKTFFVETFAKIVGWPLVTLNPGHFIRRGLELIEATSSEIFSDLLNLDHAVVFFDECDELFRTRQDGAAASRNILSFATASMLPKLQALHDARRVIFFLGTNYLQNVDDAIRRQGRFDDTLFFDRPDDTARAELIKKIWRAKKGEAEQLEVSELQWGVEYTTGWMIKEVINYAKALAAGEPPPKPPNIDDYLDWCLAERKDQPPVGEQELTASRLGPAAKEDILKRWKKVKEYDDAREK
jgi:adenylate kinase family enzyme